MVSPVKAETKFNGSIDLNDYIGLNLLDPFIFFSIILQLFSYFSCLNVFLTLVFLINGDSTNPLTAIGVGSSL